MTTDDDALQRWLEAGRVMRERHPYRFRLHLEAMEMGIADDEQRPDREGEQLQ